MLTRRQFGLGLVAGLVLTLAAPLALAANDATGTWKWTIPAQGNRPERNVSLKLKQDGEKLTGTYNGGGNNAQDVEIADGKVKDGDVSFKVTMKRGNNEITQTYTAKVDGDTMKGKVETGGNNSRSRDFEAKREK
jgi:hypothetical protein